MNRAKLEGSVVRKFEQAVRHSEALKDALAEGDHEKAWKEAVLLKQTTTAAKRLVQAHGRASRRT